MVRKLGLVDPAGFPLKIPFLAKAVFVSPLGEWLMNLFGQKMLLAGLHQDTYQIEIPPEWVEQFLKQMQYKGFMQATLSTMRHGPLLDMADAYSRVGKQEREILLIWGRQDPTIPFEINERVRQAIPHAEFHAIDEAGHLPHLEQANAFNSLLIEFLKK